MIWPDERTILPKPCGSKNPWGPVADAAEVELLPGRIEGQPVVGPEVGDEACLVRCRAPIDLLIHKGPVVSHAKRGQRRGVEFRDEIGLEQPRACVAEVRRLESERGEIRPTGRRWLRLLLRGEPHRLRVQPALARPLDPRIELLRQRRRQLRRRGGAACPDGDIGLVAALGELLVEAKDWRDVRGAVADEEGKPPASDGRDLLRRERER
jgi:hypothetical protein